MSDSIGKNIRRLRKDRNLTQEELAERLNVSAVAVSKWENNQSMPDISQIIPLARFFDITTDELFGLKSSDREEEILRLLKEIYTLHDNCPDGEEGSTGLLILEKYRDAIRQFPGDSNLLTEACAFSSMFTEYNAEQIKELIGHEGLDGLVSECCRWAEQVVRYADSIPDILSAKDRLIEIAIRQKRWDDAHRLAAEFPRSHHDLRGTKKADILWREGKTEEQRKQNSRDFSDMAEGLVHEAAMLGNSYMNAGEYENALVCYDFIRDFLDLLYGTEEYRPPFIHEGYVLFRFPAYCLMKLGRDEEAIDRLEKSIPYEETVFKNYNKKESVDCLLLSGNVYLYGHDGKAQFTEKQFNEKVHDIVAAECFEPLRKNERYRTLIDRIEDLSDLKQ